MDSLLRSSKFIDLKKSFSSIQTSRVNNSYGGRNISKNNTRKQSVYAKFSNRTYGNSEPTEIDQNIPPINESVSQIALGKNNDSVASKGDKFLLSNAHSRGPDEGSFHLQYSNTSPLKSTHEIYERSDCQRSQTQNGKIVNSYRVEKDNDGFAVPMPVHRPRPHNARLNEEEERLTKALISELIDCLSNVEAFYYLKRYEEWLLSEKKNKAPDLLNGFHGLDKDKILRVVDWLYSNSCDPPPVGNRDMGDDYISVSSRNTMHHQMNHWQRFNLPGSQQTSVFLLKNWTIIKGNEPLDLMVSGDLRDMKDQTLIEEGHVSSGVLSADATIVKTTCCVYHLIGEFTDNNNSIPEDIKKYFVDGKFPKQWKDIVRKWHLIKQKQSMQYFSNRSINGYEDKLLTDYSVNSRKRKAALIFDGEVQKEVSLKKRQSELSRVIPQTPMMRKSTNFSIVTRSALKKMQGRYDYSVLETPKSTKVYNKLKSRIKTPMPRRGRGKLSD